MKTLTLVRIERKGKGIFRPANRSIMKYRIVKQVYNRHNVNFPIPQNDNIDLWKDEKDWFCGYKTVDQFQEWINLDELQFFISKGFNIFMIEVSDFQVGNNQIIFTKESIINKKDITNIFI